MGSFTPFGEAQEIYIPNRNGLTYDLPDGDAMFEVALINGGYPQLIINTGSDCKNRGIYKIAIRAKDDCGNALSEYLFFDVNIFERECKDSAMWMFHDTFRETRKSHDQ